MIHRILRSRSRGIAIVEFALVAPVLMLFLGGIVDFASAFRARMALSQSVTSGADYAFAMSRASPEQALNTADVILAAQAAAPAGSNVSAIQTTAACVANAVLTSADANGECPDGMDAGDYLKIQAVYKFSPLFPVYSTLASTDFSESIIVRIR